MLHDVARRALHLHGALGVSNEMPFMKLTVARRTLKEYVPVDTPFPSGHLPTRRAEAQALLAERLELEVAEL